MRLELDHVAVLGRTLGEAVGHVESRLGVALGPGGRHAHFATHNRLTGLARGLYLEAIAVDPDAPPPGRARWFGLDRFDVPPRLDKWVLRCDDLRAAVAALPEAGIPVALARGDLRWSMAVPQDGLLPWDGLFPALIEWHTTPTPGETLDPGPLSLHALVIRHPRAFALRDRLSPWLDDDRVRFELGAPGLVAQLDGPDGRVWLR